MDNLFLTVRFVSFAQNFITEVGTIIQDKDAKKAQEVGYKSSAAYLELWFTIVSKRRNCISQSGQLSGVGSGCSGSQRYCIPPVSERRFRARRWLFWRSRSNCIQVRLPNCVPESSSHSVPRVWTPVWLLMAGGCVCVCARCVDHRSAFFSEYFNEGRTSRPVRGPF